MNTDWSTLIRYGRAVLAVLALEQQEDFDTISLGDPGTSSPLSDYLVLTRIYANDLGTDNNPARSTSVVVFGYVAQNAAGDVLVCFRGTQGIHEWLHDCEFNAVPCPVSPESGFTEDGFSRTYTSLCANPNLSGPSIAEYVAKLIFPKTVRSITVCGHSLGGALATLMALDLAVRMQRDDIQLYTYASPRLGDRRFAEAFNSSVPNACRVANRLDIVPETPPNLLCHKRPYVHVERLLLLPPRMSISMHIACMHHITTYLYLLMEEAGLQEAASVLHPRCLEGNAATEAHPAIQFA